MIQKKKTLKVTGLTMLFLMLAATTFSKTFNVSVANFQFTPQNLNNVNVGDTITWTRMNGSHTTTCDGTNGTVRPSGADAWSSPLDASSPTFSYIVRVAGIYNYVCIPHSPDMTGSITAVTSSVTQITEMVRGFELSQNYPNPFNPSTSIKFSVPNSSVVLLKVYDNMGKEVTTLLNEGLTAGTYRINWNAANFTSGIYYYKIEAEQFIETRKMLLIK